VNESFDSRLQLDERAVVGDRNDLSGNPRPDRVLRRHVLPRIALELLQPERDALALPVDVENLHLELGADLDQLRGVRDPAP
jgi:hypothetical protein